MLALLCLAAAALCLTWDHAEGATYIPIQFVNEAANGVTLMTGCESRGHLEPGDGAAVNLEAGGPNKLWVVPDGCSEADGCYACQQDCLGCFYLSADTSSPAGIIVTGIGFGHNDPVKVHDEVGSMAFVAKNQFGKEESVTCSVASCDFHHIIQAQNGTGKAIILAGNHSSESNTSKTNSTDAHNSTQNTTAPTPAPLVPTPAPSVPAPAPAVPTPAPVIPTPAPVVPTPTPPGLPSHVPWIKGTWTTGYWDCCKPSCAWPGKGRVDKPMFACDARTGRISSDSNARSVCDGGTSATCSKHQPFVTHSHLTLGFAAAAVSGNHGLTGDENCGQCFHLRFLDKMHDGGVWGGSHRHLVNKSMVVQVINIGQDVTGSHSFDIQIPGAGQGIFHNGCTAQYPGFSEGDFDCDNRYGGCHDKRGCGRLPKDLQAGCEWRYDWFHWLREGGQTNNPWIQFRRVRCPTELTDITGSTPLDDDQFRPVQPTDYYHGA